jgi:glucose-6-phosphate 1-dehydrogenase
MSAARADALVLFGATGDLARKQLLPSLYRLAARGQLDCPVALANPGGRPHRINAA